jgi:hypothetical protein
MIAAIAFAGLIQAVVGQACTFDREAMLALSHYEFDQTDKGWRGLSLKGCDKRAADLIRDYRQRHADDDYLLYWHEGQLRAGEGQAKAAIKLFERSKRPVASVLDTSWNLYAEGTIAYLKRDRNRLQKSRNALASLAAPATIPVRKPDGTAVEIPFPKDIPWPVNLGVLDGLLRCFSKPYKDAYACTKPPAIPLKLDPPPTRPQ